MIEKISVLLAEDEQNAANFLKLELECEGFVVHHAADGKEALELFEQNDYDILLLDWMMPIVDGITVCKRIRKKSNVPIIILTARDYVGDKISGLDSGADDYMTKPFDVEELFARVRALFRRSQASASSTSDDSGIICIDSLKINTRNHQVTRVNEKIDLTKKEFDLLLYLIEKNGEAVTRDEILNTVWGHEYIGQTNVVDVYILHLRNKIEVHGEVKLIKTVRGVGYRIEVENE